MPTTQVGSQLVHYDEQGTGHPLLLITGQGGTHLPPIEAAERFNQEVMEFLGE